MLFRVKTSYFDNIIITRYLVCMFKHITEFFPLPWGTEKRKPLGSNRIQTYLNIPLFSKYGEFWQKWTRPEDSHGGNHIGSERSSAKSRARLAGQPELTPLRRVLLWTSTELTQGYFPTVKRNSGLRAKIAVFSNGLMTEHLRSLSCLQVVCSCFCREYSSWKTFGLTSHRQNEHNLTGWAYIFGS